MNDPNINKVSLKQQIMIDTYQSYFQAQKRRYFTPLLETQEEKEAAEGQSKGEGGEGGDNKEGEKKEGEEGDKDKAKDDDAKKVSFVQNFNVALVQND